MASLHFSLNGTGLANDNRNSDLDSRTAVLSALRREYISLPDLRPVLQAWPAEVNPHVEAMRTDITAWLDDTLPPGKALDALKNSDFGLFGAAWWPRASFERLRIVTYLAVWLFTWDDEIDGATGPLWEDFESAQQFRLKTISYVSQCLGLESESKSENGIANGHDTDTDNGNETPLNQIIQNFTVIGHAIRDAYNVEQRQRVFDEMVIFMQMSEQEQRLRLSGKIPSWNEFWSYRLGSSAVTVCLAVLEFSYGDLNLPSHILDDPDMKLVWTGTNEIISAMNDVLSLKKELRQDAIDSLIPILYSTLGNTQAAMTTAFEFITKTVGSFDDAAARLTQRYQPADAEVRRQLDQFIAGSRFMCTGNLAWSLQTNRYGVDERDIAT